jgi:hypothetical protein
MNERDADRGWVASGGEISELAVVTAIQHGDRLDEASRDDGPVVPCVDTIVETEAGVDVRGTLTVRGRTGYRVAGIFVDPAPSRLAAMPGQALALAMPNGLGATE